MFNFFKRKDKNEKKQPEMPPEPAKKDETAPEPAKTKDVPQEPAKRPAPQQADKVEIVIPEGEEIIDDPSFIQEMRHLDGPWHRYDVLIDAMRYGWKTMVDWAAYLETADLEDISTITVAEMANFPETELIEDYRSAQGGLKAFAPLSEERGQLAIGGISRVLKAPVKFVWFNQTRGMRLFTPESDEMRIVRYVETATRRTFGTENEMKLAKPYTPKTPANEGNAQ